MARRFFALAAFCALALMPVGGSAAEPDAKITNVLSAGRAGAYDFTVTIKSNDTGCGHYVDWWEVVDASGALLYRRVLLHDHADEQPFTRDGGPVAAAADQVVIVRAHVNTSGYSPAAFRGSVQSGFHPYDVPAGYAAELAKKQPLPDVC